MFVTAFYDSDRKGIGFVRYSRQVGDGVFQEFMVRIPRKVTLLPSFQEQASGHLFAFLLQDSHSGEKLERGIGVQFTQGP